MTDIIKIDQLSPSLYLTWVVNNICTNSCSYCPPDLHNGKNTHYEWEDAERFSKYLISKYSKIQLALSGGEPTISPWFKDLVKLYSDSGNPTGMTTNGARTIRYYDEISKYMSYIVMSYHPSFEDPELLDKALACSKNTLTTISVMFDSRYFNKSLEFYEKAKIYSSISLQPIMIQYWPGVETTAGRDYTEDQLSILKNLTTIEASEITMPKNLGEMGGIATYDNGTISRFDAQILINNKKTNFFGWECDIGMESLFVRYDGTIKTANCNSAKIIGNLNKFEEIEWPDKTFICPQTFCHCTTDVYVSKRLKNV